MSQNDDFFLDVEDDNTPVTRGEVRRLSREIRNDLKWTTMIVLVGNQALGHIEVPATAGFLGAAAAVVLYAAKILFARP
jgi:hypothetical protein